MNFPEPVRARQIEVSPSALVILEYPLAAQRTLVGDQLKQPHGRAAQGRRPRGISAKPLLALPWDGVPGRSFERLVEAFRFALEPSLGTSGFRFHGLQFLLATFGSPPFSPVVV